MLTTSITTYKIIIEVLYTNDIKHIYLTDRRIDMAFFDDFGKKISNFGQSTVRKTKDVTETARINFAINDEEKNAFNIYRDIGRIYVQLHPNDPDPSLSEYVAQAVAVENKIAAYRKQLLEVKGVVNCSKCGAEIPANSGFCTVCGNATVTPDSSNPDEVPCPACGNLIEKDLVYCTLCGAQTNFNTNFSFPVPSFIPTPNNNAAHGNIPEPETSSPGKKTHDSVKPDIPRKNASYYSAPTVVLDSSVLNENTILCSKCGAIIKEGSAFCTACGNDLNAKKPSEEKKSLDMNKPFKEKKSLDLNKPSEEKKPLEPDKTSDETKEIPKSVTPQNNASYFTAPTVILDSSLLNENTVLCSKCGAIIKEGSAFCTTCGNDLNTKNPSEEKKSLDLNKPSEEKKSLDLNKPSEEKKSLDLNKPSEEKKSLDLIKPSEEKKSLDLNKPSEEEKSLEPDKTSDETKEIPKSVTPQNSTSYYSAPTVVLDSSLLNENTVLCNKCGAIIKEGTAFCTACGNDLNAKKPCEEEKFLDLNKPSEEKKSLDPNKPSEEKNSLDLNKPSEKKKSLDLNKPSEEKKPLEPNKPSDVTKEISKSVTPQNNASYFSTQTAVLGTPMINSNGSGPNDKQDYFNAPTVLLDPKMINVEASVNSDKSEDTTPSFSEPVPKKSRKPFFQKKPEVKCTACGTMVTSNLKFCINCGAELDKSSLNESAPTDYLNGENPSFRDQTPSPTSSVARNPGNQTVLASNENIITTNHSPLPHTTPPVPSDKKKCPNCRAEMSDKMIFCTNCGAKL